MSETYIHPTASPAAPTSPTPVVSVMVPVYNTGRYLAATIEGILSQTFTDWELVAIDDGSTDDSAAILKRYADRDPRVRFVSRANRGIVHTRNELLAMARGRYLAVNDSDDISLPNRLADEVRYLDEHPDTVVVGGWFDLIDAAGRRLTTLRPPADDAGIQRDLLAGHCSITHSCGLMRRDAVDRVGGYRTDFTFAHDLDLWLRLGEVGRLANLERTVVQFRLHESSVSENKRYEQRQFCRRACEDAWARRGTPQGQRVFEANEPWRPGRDRRSRHEFALRYGWWAFNSGERRTAAVYAAKALAALPFDPGGWKLAACAALKSPRPAAALDGRGSHPAA
jgi:glycosyltransferase involved in cell wall biosynthesis